MTTFKNFGNTEFLGAFIYLHYKYWSINSSLYYSNEDTKPEMYYLRNSFTLKEELKKNPRFMDYQKILQKFLGNINLEQQMIIRDLYISAINEAMKRGLTIEGLKGKEISKDEFYQSILFHCIYTSSYRKWYDFMYFTPTYIREIYATNYICDMDINDSNSTFDYPVQEACKILYEKGYLPYWSSANIKDATDRTGHVIKGKNVAYILIDSSNLTPELKEALSLDGNCEFWGGALSHSDNGKYYGIWAEITSVDMPCDTLKSELETKAKNLPRLKNDDLENKKKI